jgi:hypothetical protein
MDPSSSPEFNQFVKALLIYTQEDNGLAPGSLWGGNVFCNPPGGLVNEFWNKLCKSYAELSVEKAFWVGFSVEQLCTLASEPTHPMDYSTCILRKRLSFNQQKTVDITQYIPTGPDEGYDQCIGQREDIIVGDSPAHGNYVTALGCDPALFNKLFSPYGKISHGALTARPPIIL